MRRLTLEDEVLVKVPATPEGTGAIGVVKCIMTSPTNSYRSIIVKLTHPASVAGKSRQFGEEDLTLLTTTWKDIDLEDEDEEGYELEEYGEDGW